MHPAQQLVALTRECVKILPMIKSSVPPAGRSQATEAEYLRVAEALIRRGGGSEVDLIRAVQDTRRPTTFYKRLAALRFSCAHWMSMYCSQLSNAPPARWPELMVVFENLRRYMLALVALQRQGMGRARSKRQSKRQALKGLPPDWRVQLCARGASGKYALPLLVAALSGARPSELAKGIKVSVSAEGDSGGAQLSLHIDGAKVKAGQGLPHRRISYALDEAHPLVVAFIQILSDIPAAQHTISVADPGNFSKEVQRLARSLWPAHKDAVTAYCFRHQWSADVKAGGDYDSVSRGLGHRSAKPGRSYGTASQSRGLHRLRPASVDASLSPCPIPLGYPQP